MSMNGSSLEGSEIPNEIPNTMSAFEAAGISGDDLLNALGGDYRSMDVSNNSNDSDSVSVNTTSTKSTVIENYSNNKSLLNEIEPIEEEDGPLNPWGDDLQHTADESNCGKRSNNENSSDEGSPRMRRPRRSSNDNCATSKKSKDVVVSSLTKRLNQLTVREREKAMYDLHGINESLHNEEDPQKVQKLLREMDRILGKRLRGLECSMHEAPSTERERTRTMFKMDYYQESEEGLRLAKQQNPGYVDGQRIKFLRTAKFDAQMASTRMVRYFHMKRELFCAPGYNQRNGIDPCDCLGRDLRLSDFSREDLELWNRTGFVQLCEQKDRAGRAILVFFGKRITEANIPPVLVLRTYFYLIDFWSRDDAMQRAGFVAVAYSNFSGANEGLVDRYLMETFPILAEIAKVGASLPMLCSSTHFCFDHPKIQEQFKKLASVMSMHMAARLRCHYADASKPETSFLASPSTNSQRKRIGNAPNQDSSSSVNSNRPTADNSGLQSSHLENDNNGAPEFNAHKELLYALMTFGIPRDTIPVNDVTGEIYLDFHQGILEAIEKHEHQDRLREAESSSGSGTKSSGSSAGKGIDLWMSLTSSTSSNKSFALFQELLQEEIGDDIDGTTSLFGSWSAAPSNASRASKNSNLGKMDTRPDMTSSLSGVPPPPPPPPPPPAVSPDSIESNVSSPSTPIATVMKPSSNDIIMGRGPWNRNHPGNLRLKAMLEREREEYEYVNRFERMRIVDNMLNELFNEHGARFLYKEGNTKRKKKDPKEQKDEEKPQPRQTPSNVWLVAEREKAHDKITHDFRNLRRQKQAPSKSPQPSPKLSPKQLPKEL